MKPLLSYLIAAVVILVSLFFVPKTPIDPWGLINLFSLLRLLLLLMILQILSYVVMKHFKGNKGGFFLGFLGGLVSSTALTASLSKQSHECDEDEVRLLSLSYLSALLGTVVEGLILVIVGLGQFHSELLWIFAGPIIGTVILLVWRIKKLQEIKFDQSEIPAIGVSSLLILGVVIAGFLVLSKYLQSVLGASAQYALTFLVCLFELHGSVIGNVQLHEREIIDVKTLGNLLAVGILSSYIAKMSLVIFVGSRSFKVRVVKYTCWLIFATGVGWFFFSGT